MEATRSAFHRLRTRLIAAKMCLEAVPGPEGDVVSTTQAAAVVELAIQAEVSKRSSEDRASLADAILQVPWHGKDRESVLAALLATSPKEEQADKKSVGRGNGTRRPGQRYLPSLLAYFSHSEWQMLLSPSVASSVKQTLMFCRLSALGAQNLSEGCKKFMGALAIYLTVGNGAFTMPASARVAVQRDVKLSWEKWSRRNQIPNEYYLKVLPPQPERLQEEQPELYSKVFGSEKPELNRLDLRVIESISRLLHSRNMDAGGGAFSHIGHQDMLGMAPHAFDSSLVQQVGYQSQPKCLQQLFQAGTPSYETNCPMQKTSPPQQIHGLVHEAMPAARHVLEAPEAVSPLVASGQLMTVGTTPPRSEDMLLSLQNSPQHVQAREADTVEVAEQVARGTDTEEVARGADSRAEQADRGIDTEEVARAEEVARGADKGESQVVDDSSASSKPTAMAMAMLEDFLEMSGSRKKSKKQKASDDAEETPPAKKQKPSDVEQWSPPTTSLSNEASKQGGKTIEITTKPSEQEKSSPPKTSMSHEASRHTYRVRQKDEQNKGLEASGTMMPMRRARSRLFRRQHSACKSGVACRMSFDLVLSNFPPSGARWH